MYIIDDDSKKSKKIEQCEEKDISKCFALSKTKESDNKIKPVESCYSDDDCPVDNRCLKENKQTFGFCVINN